MSGRRVDGLALARRRAVAQAVVRRAQMRAALDDTARDVARRPGRERSTGLEEGRSVRRRSTPRRCR